MFILIYSRYHSSYTEEHKSFKKALQSAKSTSEKGSGFVIGIFDKKKNIFHAFNNISIQYNMERVMDLLELDKNHKFKKVKEVGVF